MKDPIVHCPVHKEIGCSHVDGYLCEVETCPIITKYKCHCYNCLKDMKEDGWPITLTRMILCPDCGNKRCPKATDHNLECTNSNEPGQKGSRYE